MSKNRIKATVPAIKSREEMESVIGLIAGLKVKEVGLKAMMDEELQAVRTKFEAHLTATTEEMSGHMQRAQAWAEANGEEFGKARSIDMLHGVVGWRIGQPQLKTIPGWTWDRVLEGLRALARLRQYVRTKQEVNKQAILDDREALGDGLRVMGVRVVQEEMFYVEPKLTEVEKRETAVAS